MARFDHDRHLLRSGEQHQADHVTPEFALDMLKRGNPGDAELAAKIIEAAG